MKSVSIALVAVVCLMIFTGSAQAVKFDPLFRVTAVQGSCNVQPKGKSAFEPAESGKAYHYGSRIKTDRNSSLIILLADGNECQVLANADLIMAEDARDSKLKIIKLSAGTVDVDLDPEFAEDGYGLHVETAAAICGVVGSKGSVDARADKDMSVTTLGVTEGKWFSKGDHFEIKELDAEDIISIATSIDREFTRLKNLKGQCSIDCKNSAGEMQTLEIKLNGVVKIWARSTDVGNNVTVTIIFTSPDGKVEQAFTYTEKDLRTPEEIAQARAEIKDEIRKKLEDIDKRETVVTTTTTTTTTVSSTTTIPAVLIPDTDGDGDSDVDELVLGTDPDDVTPTGRR